MQFQVPQFIEVENKIFGPLSFKQFIYVAGGAGLAFAAYTFLPGFFAIMAIVPITALSLALAFYKVNGKPFIRLLESMFTYFTKQKLYVWKKRKKQTKQEKESPEAPGQMQVPKISQSKLKDLAWSLDVHKKVQ